MKTVSVFGLILIINGFFLTIGDFRQVVVDVERSTWYFQISQSEVNSNPAPPPCVDQSVKYRPGKYLSQPHTRFQSTTEPPKYLNNITAILSDIQDLLLHQISDRSNILAANLRVGRSDALQC